MNKKTKIYIAGHRGMVGSAVWRALKEKGYTNLLGKTSSELDLRNQIEVNLFFEQHKPDAVIIAAARVGGILANDTYGYDFLMDNLQIQSNLISASEKNNVDKVVTEEGIERTQDALNGEIEEVSEIDAGLNL
jgi:GDP-L-fucose synthase